MPAEPDEVIQAEEEGVKFLFLSAPSEVVGRDGHVIGVKCIRMRLGEPDEGGRRRPIPVEDEGINVKTDTVVIAVGETPDLSFLPENVKVTKEGTLEIDVNTLETSIPSVFAGGDVVGGPSSVIQAIALGRKAAASIDMHLWKWARKRHPKLSKVKLKDKYWHQIGNKNWVFGVEKNGKMVVTLQLHSKIPIKRHVKVKGQASPFDGNLIYWATRTGKSPFTKC